MRRSSGASSRCWWPSRRVEQTIDDPARPARHASRRTTRSRSPTRRSSRRPKLSDRYITGRFLPDKAIDLIDQAAARVQISATLAAGRGAGASRRRCASSSSEQDYASSRKQFDRATELEAQHRGQGEGARGGDRAVEEAARHRLAGGAQPSISPQIVSTLTGIPVTELTTEERQRLLKLEERLHAARHRPGGGGARR